MRGNKTLRVTHDTKSEVVLGQRRQTGHDGVPATNVYGQDSHEVVTWLRDIATLYGSVGMADEVEFMVFSLRSHVRPTTASPR